MAVDKFNIKVTDKKTKKEIPLVTGKDYEVDQAGYVITGVENTSYGEDGDCDVETGKWTIKQAGTYNITIQATNGLVKSNSVIGTHVLKVTVKGVNLKAKDFRVEGKKSVAALEYTGESTEKPVAVTLAKPDKFPQTDVSKIPMAYGSKKVQATKANINNKANEAWNKLNSEGFNDEGAAVTYSLAAKGVYNVTAKAENADLNETYTIEITPSGKYYTTESKTGNVVLGYKRSIIDLKKAADTLVKVEAAPAEYNAGGTFTELKIDVKGMNPVKDNDDYSTIASGNKVYMTNYTASNGKQYVKYDGADILELAYAKNKKLGTAKVTLKPTKAGKNYFKNTKPVDFTIKAREITAVDELSANAVNAANAGKVFAIVNDVVTPKNGKAPKISATVYQVNETGDKAVKLAAKKDFVAAAGKFVSTNEAYGYPIELTAGSKGTFTFKDGTKSVVTAKTYFNTFDAKAKKIKVSLSQGEATGYDAAKKGYVYTGSEICPSVTGLIVNGTPYTLPAEGIGPDVKNTTSSNFVVSYSNNTKVGTGIATITLKYDAKTKAYPFGGTIKVKYKIVPHTNNKLILSK